ncbi:hypothetical protein G9A89_014765 [Geosiphon pyriformis]|nr:hypothetical protein G9A89_014765 [Geosiphon pyriformis]
MSSILTTPSESTEDTQWNRPDTKPLLLTKPAFSMFALNLDLINQTLDRCNSAKNLTKSTTIWEVFLTLSKTLAVSAHQTFITKSLHKTEYLLMSE